MTTPKLRGCKFPAKCEPPSKCFICGGQLIKRFVKKGALSLTDPFKCSDLKGGLKINPKGQDLWVCDNCARGWSFQGNGMNFCYIDPSKYTSSSVVLGTFGSMEMVKHFMDFNRISYNRNYIVEKNHVGRSADPAYSDKDGYRYSVIRKS